MKKLLLFSSALLYLNLINAQNVAINSTGAVGNASAMLDVASTTSGLLVPRMTTAQRNAIASPVQGLLVYDLTLEQFYYYDLAATAWKALSGWTLFGNVGTNDPAIPATYGTSTIGANENWMGATDAQDVVFGTNTIERFRITKTNGDIGIGTANPTEKLHVYEINNVNKSTIFGYATQASTSADFDNRAILGIAKGGNATWGYAIGVTGLADQANSYQATGVYAGLSATVPSFISGDQALYADGNSLGYAGIFMNGNVGVGTTSPGTSRLNVTIASSDATNPTGITVSNNYSGASTQYGINNTVSTDGSGIKYGVYNTVNGLAADASSIYGLRNDIVPNGTGSAYALYNYISPIGTGTRYGMYTDVNTLGSSASSTYGQYTVMDNDGTGGSYGLYINSTGLTTGTEYGVYLTGEDVNYFSGQVGIGVVSPNLKLEIDGGNDVVLGTTNSGYLHIGPSTGSHISIDNNEIMSKATGTTSSTLYIQNEGGDSYLGGNVGIGDNTPSYLLEVSGSNGWSVVQAENTSANSTGIVGKSNGATAFTLTEGSGGAFTSLEFGVYGKSTSTTTTINRCGGYFETNASGSYAYVGHLTTGNVARKISGNGAVSTIVKDLNENNVYLTCPEAPEILFEDYGSGKLINGTAHITIDPIFVKNVVINENHPLRVFIQLRGECKGVYVTNETQNSFDVIELNQGNSNVEFMFHIIANRADETLPDGSISKYSSERFASATGPQTTKKEPIGKEQVDTQSNK